MRCILAICLLALPSSAQGPSATPGAAFDEIGSVVVLTGSQPPPCRLFYPDSAGTQKWWVTGQGVDGLQNGARVRVVGTVCAGPPFYPLSCALPSPFNCVTAVLITPIGWLNYCTASVNSTGVGAVIGAEGNESVAMANLVLTARDLPVGQPGLFYYGPTQTQVTFGNGIRCVAGSAGQVFRLFPFSVSDSLGNASYALNFAAAPSGPLMAGSVWNYQFWYRDPAAGAAGFNLTNGLEVTFTP